MRQNGRFGPDGARLTEERPYHLMNCTVGQFRAFLWISADGVRYVFCQYLYFRKSDLILSIQWRQRKLERIPEGTRVH